MHNQIQTWSWKNYSAEYLTSTLKDIKFPNYDIFSDVNVAYADLTKKISDAIDSVSPIKTLRIKNNSKDWFDSEITEAIKLREKYLKNSKNPTFTMTMIFTLRQSITCKNWSNKRKLIFVMLN